MTVHSPTFSLNFTCNSNPAARINKTAGLLIFCATSTFVDVSWATQLAANPLEGCWVQSRAESTFEDGHTAVAKVDCIHVYSGGRNIVACDNLRAASVYSLSELTSSQYTRARTDFYIDQRRTNSDGEEPPRTYTYTREGNKIVIDRENSAKKRSPKDPVKFRVIAEKASIDTEKACAKLLEFAIPLDKSSFGRDHYVDSFEKILFRRFDEAREALKRGRTVKPEDPLIMNNYAVMLAQNGDYSTARALLEAALPFAKSYEVADEVGIYVPNVKGGAVPDQLVVYQPREFTTPIKEAYAEKKELAIAYGETAFVKFQGPKPIDPSTKKRRPYFTLDAGIEANIRAIKKLQR